MAQTFFFYDLETSGVNPAYQRIMQFAGQRTDLDLKPIGEPLNMLVKLTDDILPEPDAILIHGITPQRSIREGISERELAKLLQEQVFTNDTIAVGFNNIRFDDEFIRHLFWRNFYDSYEWSWKGGRSRWDLLDVTRMTRALRPDGLNWPVDADGVPTNRLASLTQANGIALKNAHDALEDIQATIEWAQRLKSAQPKLFEFLLYNRDKRSVEAIIAPDSPKPFVYTSGWYKSEFLKTTAAIVIGPHPDNTGSVLVYDLRHNPDPFARLGLKELGSRLFVKYEDRETTEPLPVKKLSLNKCPAVAPLITLDNPARQRLQLDVKTIEANRRSLKQNPGFINNVRQAFADAEKLPRRVDPEGQLYDGFLSEKDRSIASLVLNVSDGKLRDLELEFKDNRLTPLFLRYKARNLPAALTDQERALWEGWRGDKLIKGVDNSLTFARFGERLQALANTPGLSDNHRYLLEELQLYGQSIAPASLFDV